MSSAFSPHKNDFVTGETLRRRDDLLQFLRPFAEADKVVDEGDVRRFFEERQEAMREAREQSGCKN